MNRTLINGTLQMPFTNCENNLILTLFKNCSTTI